MQEIRGFSEGSGLPLENFLLHSMSSEIWLVDRPQGVLKIYVQLISIDQNFFILTTL